MNISNIDTTTIIEKAYKLFNARDIDGVLHLMHSNVQWPNGWKGGILIGHDAIRDYWTAQWKELDPHVSPVSFASTEKGALEVTVKQIVKSPNGDLLFDGLLKHVYTFLDGKIIKMEIIE
jgi:hypothetical protein